MNVRLVEGRISILFRSIENVAASDYAVFEQDLKILSERIKLLLVAFKLASELLKTSLHFFLVHRAKIAHFCRYSTLSDFRAPVCSRRSIINNDQNEIGSLWPARALSLSRTRLYIHLSAFPSIRRDPFDCIVITASQFRRLTICAA